MAYKNKVLQNPHTGQSITFLQTAKDTDGALLEMESTWRGNSQEPMGHYHPLQDEDFTVLQGELTVKLNGETKILNAGDTLHIPRRTVHAMWNAGTHEARANWKVLPALDTENLFETTTGLAIDGKTNDKGVPNLWQVALTIGKYDHVFRMTKPPFAVQKILFGLLTPVAYMLGYRPTYRRYLD